jgi:UDP-N-acetylglucosamine 2-epimerase (non-hydrolysing)
VNGDPVHLLHVCGARPNFMKVAPVMAAVEAWNASRAGPSPSDGAGVRFTQTLVHTGQHYDAALSDVFIRQLGLPEPDHHLGVGSGSHAAQTAAVLQSLEPVLLKQRPALVVVVGDVNSTVAAALCAAKLHIPVAHVEAGLRSGDRGMPEELNRLLTDQIADLLFITEADAADNLAREGIDHAKVHFVGNTMIDTLERLLPQARGGEALGRLGLTAGTYGLVTLHRPTNVDDAAQLEALVAALRRIARQLPLVWPVHPRTRAGLDALLQEDAGSEPERLLLTEPLGYLEFLQLMDGARVAITDSGGIQEETTVLGVPCLTLRTTTERPVTVSEGTNRLVDPSDAEAILVAADEALAVAMPRGVRPELWDGHTSERIVEVIAEWAGHEV